MNGFYARLRENRHDEQELQDCIEEVTNQLAAGGTTSEKPGMLLGKIQSGKTRGFLGIITRAFDKDFDIALVLTKGTKTLARQTVNRISSDFKEFIDDELISVYDVMEMPQKMTRSELRRKIVIVAKKETNNLARLVGLFDEKHPELKERRVLLVDDEADMASVRFVKKKGSSAIQQGTIANQMDHLRRLIKNIAFLQVTATPYALYLQPEDYQSLPADFVFFPKKPKFTSLLPIHSAYVGGDDYFEDYEKNDPRTYLYVEVSEEEHTVLREADRRSIRQDRIWSNKNISILRGAIMRFFLATVVRRCQDKELEKRPSKYAMIIHNDTKRSAHEWQNQTIGWICDAFETAANNPSGKFSREFTQEFEQAYADISASVNASGGIIPDLKQAFEFVCELIADGEVNIQTVNSDTQVASLLDPTTAELKLRTKANIFIGGSILDRGITIPYLISFYYGRNPKNMQADTVLQHSRMYGNRSKQDLAVTRFYTSDVVYKRLRQIHVLEVALRNAFLNGSHDKGVVFIQNDRAKGIVPCAPNKIAVSDVVTVKPGGLYLPSSFDTSRSTDSEKAMSELDDLLSPFSRLKRSQHETDLKTAVQIIKTIARTISKPKDLTFSWEAMESLLTYYTGKSVYKKVLVMTDDGRKIDRANSGDKSGLSILGTSLRPSTIGSGRDMPILILLKQEGSKQLSWSAGTPFWWPILAAPTTGMPCVYGGSAPALP